MDENQAVYDGETDDLGRLSRTEQVVRSVLIVGCALGVIFGLALASMITP